MGRGSMRQVSSRRMLGLLRNRISLFLCISLMLFFISAMLIHHCLVGVSDDSESQLYGSMRQLKMRLEYLSSIDTNEAYDLKKSINEMLNIQVSVNNELKNLEQKRLQLKEEIAQYNQNLENLKVQVSTQQAILGQIDSSIKQAQLTKSELDKFLPRLYYPARTLRPLEVDPVFPSPNTTHSLSCKMHHCFDYAKCSLTGGMPFQFQVFPDGEEHILAKKFVRAAALEVGSISDNSSVPVKCVNFVVLENPVTPEICSIPSWKGDGRNHILVMIQEDLIPRSVEPIGRAMNAQSYATEWTFRPGFDIVIPPLLSSVEDDLPLMSPARRVMFLSFLGEFLPTNDSVVEPQSKSENQTMGVQSMNSIAHLIVNTLRNLQGHTTGDRFLFQFKCSPADHDSYFPLQSDWKLCGSRTVRHKVLRDSTFSLIVAPLNDSIITTPTLIYRLVEALQLGAVPVIIGDHVQLPFAETIAWKSAVVVLPISRITELHFYLRAFSDTDILAMRRQGRMIYDTYLCSLGAIIKTLVALMRYRLNIPPLPVPEAPSPSAFNASFVPLKTAPILLGEEPDEDLGPIEVDINPLVPPSPKFMRNFSHLLLNRHEMWNVYFDPFHLYPTLPFDPLLPSEAKFTGSELGFRPIGNGAGGSGKEFAEALGGNYPKEKFTIVMLTYKREQVMMSALSRLHSLPYLHKVVLVWNSPDPPAPTLRWPDIGVPIHVIYTGKNSLNNRFLPYEAIETDAILSIDDDAHLRHDEIIFGFRVWREARDRIVGFPGRFHAWDLNYGGWNYNSNYSCELSMVLTGAAFFHKYYAYQYSYVMPQAIRDKVDEFMNCEDIAMNLLVSHLTRKPPIKVTSRWTFRCPGCSLSLSEEESHFEERHLCMNFFTKIYGYMPLLNTQFRADSVLFKTRISHNKQKCFKYV